ncbi:MAG: ATPase [Bacteroidetes bacterium]|nr:MAG: ATPase [Bacteroidota bacterium]MBL1145089.1 ATPase [Bacteroidota bacterium]MCB0802126.1 ATPase [Flavobacteriales bacterium]NOG57886.1 ATPase [Bacteroidota bacterium]
MSSNKIIKYLLRKGPIRLNILAIIAIIYDFGFVQTNEIELLLDWVYISTLSTGIVFTIARAILKEVRPRFKVIIFDFLSILFFTLVLLGRFETTVIYKLIHLFSSSGWLYAAVVLAFFRELSSLKLDWSKTYLNPAQLFILSFFGIILIGSLMLMLPNATYEKISFIDAFFTSTSAVCVTGLIVVDTASYFTFFGQFIIIVLIQIGGLGIMTFASYFSYFFRGDTSYKNQLILSDITTSNKLGEVFGTLKKIIITTLSIEIFGAILIFWNIENTQHASFFDQLFFSIFHSISAFCNAGFSTLSEGLFDVSYRFNYPFQLIIIFLFVIGGLGFPIVFNLLKYLKYLFSERIIPKITNREKPGHVIPWVINLNSRIVIITTLVLLFGSTIIIYLNEFGNSLAVHNSFGKMVTALFTASTPRTAGFHTVDFANLKFSTIMLLFLLMWIGASPASTGGGIKTNTFAIATLNFWSIARGKERIEIFRREVADISVRRSYAIISLSLIVIGTGVFLIASFDSDKDLLSIAFECFSAYSTVGLSLGITSSLSVASKFVLIAIMFIGRVSMLTIMIAIIRKVKHKNYRYSKEEILIN